MDVEQGVIALVQIDTLQKGAFGADPRELRDYARHIVLPLCLVLKVWYHKSILAEIVQDRISKECTP